MAALFSLPLVCSCSSDPERAPAPVQKPPEACASGSVDSAALKKCVTAGESTGACLEALFQPFFAAHTTAEALALLQCYEDKDDALRAQCHPIAHAIGRETFIAKGTVDAAFAACDQTCHSGCYHGVMERFLRGDSNGGHISITEIQAKAAKACDPSQPYRIRFQCLHGLGHALMYYTDYALVQSLTICDATPDTWSQRSCYGGVFMENIVSATPEMRDLSPTDLHYPCNKLDEKYKDDCYEMQTSRMREMGLNPQRILAECRNATGHEASCIESLGRDLSDLARLGKGRDASSICELGQGEEIAACTRGAVHALVDNTWDGRYALPFCSTYADPNNAASCFTATLDYMRSIFEKSADELTAECDRYVPGVTACTSAAR